MKLDSRLRDPRESRDLIPLIGRLEFSDLHPLVLADLKYVFFETKIEGFVPNYRHKLKNILKGSAIRESASNLVNKIPPNCVSSLARLPLGIDG